MGLGLLYCWSEIHKVIQWWNGVFPSIQQVYFPYIHNAWDVHDLLISEECSWRLCALCSSSVTEWLCKLGRQVAVLMIRNVLKKCDKLYCNVTSSTIGPADEVQFNCVLRALTMRRSKGAWTFFGDWLWKVQVRLLPIEEMQSKRHYSDFWGKNSHSWVLVKLIVCVILQY